MTQYSFTIAGQTDTGTLTWNQNGSLAALSIVDHVPNTSDSQNCGYTHDELGRLAAVNCGAPWSQTFAFDAFGNVSKGGSLSCQPTYSTANRYATLPGATPSYDADGNLLSDSMHTYTWDAEGHPVSVDGNPMVYGPLGRLAEAGFSWGWQETVYSPAGAKVAVMNGQSLDHAYVALPGGAQAIFNSGGLSQYRQADWLGSARLGSNTTGAAVQATAYAPYGENYSTWGGGLTFTGKDEDTVWNGTAALYDFPARRYSPTQGRWISPDPAGLAAVDPNDPQTWNRYAYVGNTPLAATDPTGLILCKSADGSYWDASTAGACHSHGGSLMEVGQQVTVSGTPGGAISTVDLWLFQEDVAFASMGGTGTRGTSSGGEFQIIPGIRLAGQTWRQCMNQHQGDYSLIGVVDLLDVATGYDTNFQHNFILGIVGGNSINGLFLGGGRDATETAVGQSPGLLLAGMGSPLTYGRRTADLMALNLSGKGGLPMALTDASISLKSGLASLGDAINLGIEATTRFAIDAALSGAESANCLNQE